MDILPFATFFVALFSSVLSGLAGGGGGFIVAPYWLLIGLTPAQGATTGAFMALGMGGGSLFAFRGKRYLASHRQLAGTLIIVTLIASLIAPFFLNSIHVEAFKPILIIVTLASLPFLFMRPTIHYGRGHRRVSFIALVGILLASSFITSSAFSILMSALLLHMFRMGVLESTALRRVLGIVQCAVLFVVLALLGNFVWTHAVAGLIGGTLGSYLGTKRAIHLGETFAKYALAIGALVGVAALIAS